MRRSSLLAGFARPTPPIYFLTTAIPREPSKLEAEIDQLVYQLSPTGMITNLPAHSTHSSPTSNSRVSGLPAGSSNHQPSMWQELRLPLEFTAKSITIENVIHPRGLPGQSQAKPGSARCARGGKNVHHISCSNS
jgi:hypothetical protein